MKINQTQLIYYRGVDLQKRSLPTQTPTELTGVYQIRQKKLHANSNEGSVPVYLIEPPAHRRIQLCNFPPELKVKAKSKNS